MSSPIIGPAHQIALAASEPARTLSIDHGCTPIASSTATLLTIWASGPATEMSAWRAPRSGFGVENDVYPAMKSSEIEALAPEARAAIAWPSSWISVNTAMPPASQMPYPSG